MTSLGFVEYFDSVILASVVMLTQNDTTKRPSTESTQTLEILKSANVLQVRVHTKEKLHKLTNYSSAHH